MRMDRISRVACVVIFLLGVCTLMSAQQNGNQTAKAGKTTITGCIQKGSEPGGFFLTDESGKTWELSGAKVSDHVGHKVALTGMSTQESKAEEAKKASSEKTEGSASDHGDFRVTNVKMISDSCQ